VKKKKTKFEEETNRDAEGRKKKRTLKRNTVKPRFNDPEGTENFWVFFLNRGFRYRGIFLTKK
jgi:hypothetical protein